MKWIAEEIGASLSLCPFIFLRDRQNNLLYGSAFLRPLPCLTSFLPLFPISVSVVGAVVVVVVIIVVVIGVVLPLFLPLAAAPALATVPSRTAGAQDSDHQDDAEEQQTHGHDDQVAGGDLGLNCVEEFVDVVLDAALLLRTFWRGGLIIRSILILIVILIITIR